VTLERLFSRLVPVLNAAAVPYMLTGSVASSLHGTPRSTRDLDVVIDPTREQLIALVRRSATMDYFADEQQAIDAFTRRSQFNVIDNVTGWKVDLIFMENSEYGKLAFERRSRAIVLGNEVEVCSAEDILLAKMRWAKASGSDRQLQDAAGIIATQGDALDSKYLHSWTESLGLQNEWTIVLSHANGLRG